MTALDGLARFAEFAREDGHSDHEIAQAAGLENPATRDLRDAVQHVLRHGSLGKQSRLRLRAALGAVHRAEAASEPLRAAA